MTDTVWLLHAQVKDDTTIRLFRDLAPAKEAAQKLWDDWLDDDATPLQWAEGPEYEGITYPTNPDYTGLSAMEEVAIYIELTEIE